MKKLIPFFCAIFIAISCFFVFRPNNNIVACADSFSQDYNTYSSSSFVFPIGYNDQNSNISRFDQCVSGVGTCIFTFRLVLYYDSSNIQHFSLIVYNQLVTDSSDSGVVNFGWDVPLFDLTIDSFSGVASTSGFVPVSSGSGLHSAYGYYVYRGSNNTFPDFSSLLDFCVGNSSDGYYGNRLTNNIVHGNFNYFRLSFSDGWSLLVGVPMFNTNNEYSSFSYQLQKVNFMRYYRELPSSDSSDIYEQGRLTGYSEGLSDGEEIGFNDGYYKGKEVGFAQGKNEGLAATDYSFSDLFGSVVDAPVTVLSDLFNFNILGINLWSLFTGLFTLCVLIFILRLILAR